MTAPSETVPLSPLQSTWQNSASFHEACRSVNEWLIISIKEEDAYSMILWEKKILNNPQKNIRITKNFPCAQIQQCFICRQGTHENHLHFCGLAMDFKNKIRKTILFTIVQNRSKFKRINLNRWIISEKIKYRIKWELCPALKALTLPRWQYSRSWPTDAVHTLLNF